MKSVIKKFVKPVVFAAIFVVLFFLFQAILQAKWYDGPDTNAATTSYWDEYRSLDEDSLDVLFLGTSHILYATDPMEIYHQTGLASFVMFGPGMRLDLTYVALKDALKSQHPKVIVLDISGIHYDEQQIEGRIHKVTDLLPFSLTKLEYALTTESEGLDPLNVIFPFFRYHDRWEELEANDFKALVGLQPKTVVRGHFINYLHAIPDFHFYQKVPGFQVSDWNKEALDKIVNLCKEEGIELIFCKIPTPDWNITYSEAAQELADEYGVTYLELYYRMKQIGLDIQTDFKDESDHMNQYGAEKMSAWWAEYFAENYDFEDHRGIYTQWDEDYEEYELYKQQTRERYAAGDYTE